MLDMNEKWYVVGGGMSCMTIADWARENDLAIDNSTTIEIGDTNLYQLDVTKGDDLSVVHVKFGKTPDKLMNGQREIGTVRHDFFLHCMVITPKIRDR